MRIAALGMVLALSMGCYTVQLKPIPEVAGRPLGETATIDVPGESASYVYDVRSFAAGVGNRWRIEVGDALVKYAEAYLRPVFPEGDDLRIHITVEGFDVRGFETHIEGRFTVSRGSEIVFNDDGLTDLVSHYRTQGTGIEYQSGTSEVSRFTPTVNSVPLCFARIGRMSPAGAITAKPCSFFQNLGRNTSFRVARSSSASA